jgi:hypothetical protein
MNEIVVVTRGDSLSNRMGWDDVYQSIIGLRLLHASARDGRSDQSTMAMSGIDEGWGHALESIEGLDAAFFESPISQHTAGSHG